MGVRVLELDVPWLLSCFPAPLLLAILPGFICFGIRLFFPRQRKLMGSSAQNSSGVYWCRRRVRFNRVPEKVWEALVQSQVRFNRVPEKVPNVPEKVWEAFVQSQVRFNRVPEKVLVKVAEALVQSQVTFSRVPEKVQQGSGEGEALVQSQVRFNRICSHLIHGNPAEVFPALGFGARFRKICKIKTLRLLGYHRSLFSLVFESKFANPTV